MEGKKLMNGNKNNVSRTSNCSIIIATFQSRGL
jgi:hypothetical protein